MAIAGAGAGLTAVFLWRGARSRRIPRLRTVEFVDLDRYAGRWFEIARYPTPFQRQCEKNTTAEYAPRKCGRLYLENRCTRKDGVTECVKGTARVADSGTNAKLKVKFSPFMPAGDYWIIDLDPSYRWAVVGEPKRRFLWILSRTPRLDEGLYAQICRRLRVQHYVPERLVRTAQDGA